MKTPWIGTSWKMNKTREEARAFAEALKASAFASTEVAQPFVIPPFPYIAEVADILAGTRVKVGAQNMHWETHGAWTGWRASRRSSQKTERLARNRIG